MNVFKVPIVLTPEDRKTFQASIQGDICVIKFPKSCLARRNSLIRMADRIYWNFMGKLHAHSLLTRTIELNQSYFRLSFRTVRYHRQFRRWGSCSALKNINLSHRLIGAPQHLSDYVILHELAHLQHLNHGKEFWKLLEGTGVHPKLIRNEMNHYGYSWNMLYQQWYKELKKIL